MVDRCVWGPRHRAVVVVVVIRVSVVASLTNLLEFMLYCMLYV
jgi:hypothetical protein